MVKFKWIEWNLRKIAAHHLSTREVEFAWHHRYGDDEYDHAEHGRYYESYGPCPSGRVIKIVWRWDTAGIVEVVFVVTAFGDWRER